MNTDKAIEILESGSWSGYDDKEIAEAVQMGADALKEQKRPHGEWKCNRDVLELICSVCGETLPFSDEYDYETNFCPECGADMRKKEGESG